MPLDPSIVSNAFANVSMPDVNALMNQRVRGAENIYQIETARQAQAAEDEKAAAKAQEDAAVKALLPAYAHAFKTGDMRTALSLAPAEYQDGLLQYVEALDGKPIEEIQAALTGSLVTSDVGRAFLENQARVATLGVQQGQLDVSRGNLAIEKAKMEAEAKAGSKVAQWITGDDGTVTGLDAQGKIVATVPGIGKKTATTGPDGVKLKPGERMTAEGTVEAVPGSDLYTKQKANYTKDYKGATTVVDKIAEAQAKIDRITSEDNASGFAGNFGGYNAAYATQYFPGQTQDVASDIESLKADLKNAGLELIRNGGSIGQITEREWPIIEQQLAALTPMLGEAKARDILANVSARLKNIADRALETYDMQWGDTQFYTPVTAKPVTTGAGGATAPSAGGATAPSAGGQDINGDGVIDFNDLK
jgi:hypothetical protein